MAYNPNIQLGAPPLLWSDMNEVLVQINQNFDSLSAGGGGGPVDFNTLDTNVSPTVDDGYSLGTDSKQWKSVHVADYSTVPGQELNGLWAGTAQIKGIGGIVDLPVGSTVDGSLIIDTNKTTFKIIAVAGQGNVVADTFTSTLNIEGVGIQVTTDPLTNKVIFTSTAIRSVAGSAAISVTGIQDLTVTNTGVTSLTNTTALPGGRTAGAGINVSAATGGIDITNTGILGVSPGFGISASVDAPSGVAAISVNSASVVTNSYRNFLVSGQSTLAANGVADSMTIASGYGIVLTTSTLGTDTLTVALDQKHLDINGSIYADDSTLLVDGVDGNIVGPIYTSTLRTAESKIALGSNAGTAQGNQSVAIGENAGAAQGSTAVAIGQNAGGGVAYQGDDAVAIGHGAGENSQGTQAVAVGLYAGQVSQGINAVAIGRLAGQTSQAANTIILNATGSAVNGVAAQTNSFYVDPIRNAAGTSGVLQYDSTTKEVLYSSVISGTSFTGNIFTTLIDSADSSAITVTPKTIFSSDVDIENELTVSNGITFSDGSVLRSYSPVTVVAATTVAQTVNDAASASVIQFVETVDTAGAFTPGTFTAPYTGYYQVNLSVYFSTTVTLLSGSFLIIDTNLDNTKQVTIFTNAFTGSYLHYSTVIPATAGDAVRVVFRNYSGGPVDISSGSRITIHRVSIGA